MKRALVSGGVWMLCAATCTAQPSQDPCGIPARAPAISGSHTDGLYEFAHTSWFENSSPDLTRIGYCISLPEKATRQVWFHWPRAGLKGYTSRSTRRLRAIVPICFPPGKEPQSPDTNLWYGAQPKLKRAELFDFDGADEATVDVAGYSAVNWPGTLFAGLTFEDDRVPIGTAMPGLQSVSEFSIPAPDGAFEGGFADIVLQFESQAIRIAATDPGGPTWLYIYTWSNTARPRAGEQADKAVARLFLPETLIGLLGSAKLDRVERLGVEQPVAPAQAGTIELLSASTARPRRFAAAFFHRAAPRHEVTQLGVQDDAKVDDRPDGGPSKFPVAVYLPRRE